MSSQKLPDIPGAMLDLFKLFRVNSFDEPPVVDYDHTAKLIQSLSQEALEECLFMAATMGNVRLMNALWEQRGPIQVEYVQEAGANEELLNGRPFSSRRMQMLRNVTTSVELKILFDTIKDYGMKGLIESGATFPFIFRRHDLVSAVLLAREVRFKGELPFFDAGVVNSPELALSLTAESARSSTPNAYQPMLCWATEGMISEFGSNLVPMRPVQRVAYQGVLQPASKWGSAITGTIHASMAEFKAGCHKEGDGLILNMTLGVQPDERLSVQAGSLLHYMGSLGPAFGFADPQGRVLCETRADFLMQFPLGECRDQNLAVSEDFVTRYCPLDIICNQAGLSVDDSTGAKDLGGMLKEHKRATMALPLFRILDNFSPVFDLLSQQSSIRERALNMMTHDQWKLLARSGTDQEFLAATLITMRDVLGIDNQGMAMQIPLSLLNELHTAGYRFSDDTLVLSHKDDLYRHKKINPDATAVSFNLNYGTVLDFLGARPESELLSESIRLHRMCQSMNLWSSFTPKPKSLAHALDEMTYRTVEAGDTAGLALSVYLVDQGIDACANAVTVPNQWLSITRIFSPEEVMPYLPAMPALAKGKFLESEMGL